MSKCLICYSDSADLDEFISCQFCLNEFHVNHIAQWATIHQRCPICKEIFDIDFITHLGDIADSVDFDQDLMDAFRRDLEIEEMQLMQETSNKQTNETNDLPSSPSSLYTKIKYCTHCGDQMKLMTFKHHSNQKYLTLALNQAGEPIYYCPRDRFVHLR